MNKVLRSCSLVAIVVIGMCLVITICLALYNQKYLAPKPAPTALGELDQARLEEAVHLRKKSGDSLWDDFGSMQIPVLVWEGEQAYLVRQHRHER